MTRAVAYCRQSVSDSPDTLSLDAQAAAIRAHAAAQGWVLVAELRDADTKGWRDADERPGLAEALRLCAAGQADVLVVWKMSRLARSVRITENVLHALESSGARFASVTEPWASQPMFRQILGALAEQQTRDQREHTKSALALRRARGLHVGKIAYGYRSAGPFVPPVPDDERPERIAAVRLAFELRAAGAPVRAICHALYAAGLPTASGDLAWSKSAVETMLRNPVYRGAFNYGQGARAPEPLEGAVEPLVDPDLWRRAQRPADPARERVPRAKPEPSWLEGRILHGCGRPMYLVLNRGRGRAVRVFRCSHADDQGVGRPPCPVRPVTRSAARLEPAAWDLVRAALADLPDPERVLADARGRLAAEDPAAAVRRAALEDERAKLLGRRRRARELYLEGDLDRPGYDAALADCAAREAAVLAGLAELPAVPSPEEAAATVERLRSLRDDLDRILPEDRGAVLAVLGVVVLLPDGPALRVAPDLAHYLRRA